jgi:(E)-2-((N-methylformamido)methylene)succinate hydrolase
VPKLAFATILIHGVGLDHQMWDPVCAALPRRPIIRYDMVGHGDAPSNTGPFTLDDFVQQLANVLDTAGEQCCDIVGFSMGALVAQAFALKYPARTHRLVLLNPVFDRTPEERQAVIARVEDVQRGGYVTSIEPALRRWFSAAFAEQQPETVQLVRARLHRNDLIAYANAYTVFATADQALVSRSSEIKCPALVVTGDDDQRSTPHMARALAAALPHASVKIINGLRHLTPLESPGLIAAMIEQFFDNETESAQ